MIGRQVNSVSGKRLGDRKASEEHWCVNCGIGARISYTKAGLLRWKSIWAIGRQVNSFLANELVQKGNSVLWLASELVTDRQAGNIRRVNWLVKSVFARRIADRKASQ